ncbi:MAG: hypothetical protein KC416_07730, partial [Myxococcales bacterium]|nr:hypothetical protein [Myxococcales bacterium]
MPALCVGWTLGCGVTGTGDLDGGGGKDDAEVLKDGAVLRDGAMMKMDGRVPLPDGSLGDSGVPTDGGLPDASTDGGPDGSTDGGLVDAGSFCDGVDCSHLDQGCAVGICNPMDGSCSVTFLVFGESCDDGDYCTVNDSCGLFGQCQGAARDCSDGISCTVDSCDEDLDQCKNEPAAATCTIGGECVADGAPNPANPCQACAASTNASDWTPKAPGASCEDGNYCSTGDTCDISGACSGTPRGCD